MYVTPLWSTAQNLATAELPLFVPLRLRSNPAAVLSGSNGKEQPANEDYLVLLDRVTSTVLVERLRCRHAFSVAQEAVGFLFDRDNKSTPCAKQLTGGATGGHALSNPCAAQKQRGHVYTDNPHSKTLKW